MKYLIWISLISSIIIITNAEEGRPLISLADGLVRGVYKTSYDGRKYSAFEGIPYARPPIGNLRFQDPKPALRWEGILEGTTLYKCVQYGFFSTDIVGQEDCLYVNVYVPRKKINPDENLDVIVHFHGGAYMMGSPGEVAGPSKLMDRDLVYVNLNYRLGPLGFLSLGDDAVPGNYGMKDQSFALRWVKDNIAKFGGNPNSVTITGGSAGGTSTHLHYFSSLSKGLFHRGIAASGVGLNPWAVKKDPYTASRLLTKDLGCFNESTTQILRCMQERSALQIQQSIRKQYLNFETLLPLALFAPVIEPQSPKAFMSTDPYTQYKEKSATDVPFISTMAAEEGTCPGAFYIDKRDLLNKKLQSYLPAMLEYDSYDQDVQRNITENVRKHYLNDEPITMKNFDKFLKMCSDRLFHIGAGESVKLHASKLTTNAYLILISYGAKQPGMESFGLGHGGDFIFYYDMTLMPEYDVALNENEIEMKNKLLDMLTTFAKTGTPTIEGVNFEPVPKDGTIKYLSINGPNDLKMETSTSLGDKEFWDSLRL